MRKRNDGWNDVDREDWVKLLFVLEKMWSEWVGWVKIGNEFFFIKVLCLFGKKYEFEKEKK